MRVLAGLFVLVLAGLASPPLRAGAWPRAEGAWFVSGGVEIDAEGQGWASAYVEYGITPRLSFVLDAGRPVGHEGGSQALAVLRYDLRPGAAVKLAASLGGGLADGGWALRPGLALGRGIETRWGAGWADLDLRALWWPQRGETAWKADLTLGLNRPRGGAWLVQVQATDWPGAEFGLRLVPEMVQRVGPLRLELGMILPVSGGGARQIKLGTWLEF